MHLRGLLWTVLRPHRVHNHCCRRNCRPQILSRHFVEDETNAIRVYDLKRVEKISVLIARKELVECLAVLSINDSCESRTSWLRRLCGKKVMMPGEMIAEVRRQYEFTNSWRKAMISYIEDLTLSKSHRFKMGTNGHASQSSPDFYSGISTPGSSPLIGVFPFRDGLMV